MEAPCQKCGRLFSFSPSLGGTLCEECLTAPKPKPAMTEDERVILQLFHHWHFSRKDVTIWLNGRTITPEDRRKVELWLKWIDDEAADLAET